MLNIQEGHLGLLGSNQTNLWLEAEIKKGDIKAYERIFTAYYGTLCHFANNILGDMDKARDVVQDVFVTLYANRMAIQINTSLKSYLLKCVYNVSLNSIKQETIHSHHQYLKTYGLHRR